MCPSLEKMSLGYDKEQVIAVLCGLGVFVFVFVFVGVVGKHKRGREQESWKKRR